MPVSGPAVAATGVGLLFVWSGIRGWSVTGLATDIIQGKRPSQTETLGLTAPQSQGAGSAGSNASPSSSSSSNVANEALKYQGHCYVFGGAPGPDASRCWDCSSFVNWIVGHKLGMAIPGYGPGKYNGSVHGPPTGMWGVWPGLHRVSRSQVQAGDIIVWTGHMGIAISNSHMISAEDPVDKTRIGPIDGGGNGPLMKYGRL